MKKGSIVIWLAFGMLSFAAIFMIAYSYTIRISYYREYLSKGVTLERVINSLEDLKFELRETLIRSSEVSTYGAARCGGSSEEIFDCVPLVWEDAGGEHIISQDEIEEEIEEKTKNLVTDHYGIHKEKVRKGQVNLTYPEIKSVEIKDFYPNKIEFKLTGTDIKAQSGNNIATSSGNISASVDSRLKILYSAARDFVEKDYYDDIEEILKTEFSDLLRGPKVRKEKRNPFDLIDLEAQLNSISLTLDQFLNITSKELNREYSDSLLRWNLTYSNLTLESSANRRRESDTCTEYNCTCPELYNCTISENQPLNCVSPEHCEDENGTVEWEEQCSAGGICHYTTRDNTIIDDESCNSKSCSEVGEDCAVESQYECNVRWKYYYKYNLTSIILVSVTDKCLNYGVQYFREKHFYEPLTFRFLIRYTFEDSMFETWKNNFFDKAEINVLNHLLDPICEEVCPDYIIGVCSECADPQTPCGNEVCGLCYKCESEKCKICKNTEPCGLYKSCVNGVCE